ncbi:MAG: ectonucleotide pyrophosphatase/phosphodiesterase, partial [Limisphaerales bacterium]
MQIKKFIPCLLAGVTLLFSFEKPASAAAAAKADDQIVVLMSIDGLAAFYFDDPKAEMPTIRALAADGAHASMMKASTPTVTWPNHTTLVTGVNPAKHGVVGNNYFDRVTGEPVALIGDPEFDKEQIVKVPTLYDLAKAKGMQTVAIRWPATRNAKSLDWTIPDMKTAALAEKYSTPALLAECEQAGIQLVPGYEDHTTMDDLCTRIFTNNVHLHRPGFALLHVINVDHTQHEKGPRTPEAYAAIKAADNQVRVVWEFLQREFPGKATLFIVSDHGFSPIKRTILPNVVLKQAGLTAADGSLTNGPVAVVVQGGGAMLYVREEARRTELLAQLRQAFGKVPGVSKIIGTEQFKDYGVADPKNDPHAPDLILFAEEGCAFGNTSSGGQPFKDKVELTGTHGHDPNLPHLHATFVAWGRGIKTGVKLGEISNTSVAPTIARLLNVQLPEADGPVLEEVLAK